MKPFLGRIQWRGGWLKQKHQTPSSKLQRSTKHQASIGDRRAPLASEPLPLVQTAAAAPEPSVAAWGLELLWSLELGAWCFRSLLLLAAAFCLCASTAVAQSIPKDRPRTRPPSALTGWADWEKGEALFQRITVPPAPVRTAEEELKTFKLAPGYRVELVAAEPLVHNPIFFEFDPDGRIWVIEYQGYMRDLAGSGEDDPICRVVVLEDTDADGRMDKSTVFLDKLVMPRSFAFVKGGLLLQEPPMLWFCQDTNADLRCDQRTEVGQMGHAGNPQHTANGLRYGPDNWLHCSDSPKRYRWQDGRLLTADTIHRGQFGVTFDELGRFLTCYENRPLHGDCIPAEYVLRNPHLFRIFQRGGGDRRAFGLDVDFAPKAKEVFPSRVTPAVTLGALELRDDGRLRTYTIVAGVCAYDGHQFPADARGNVFVPEAGGHLIGRLKLNDSLAPEATRFYPPEQEFLTSTDERFRPVNARVGPDGALYLADMYHGIIEHVIFMVPWLTKQIQERHLEQGNDLGRIWRIVAEGREIDRRPPRLAQAGSADLVKTLAHPNGWHRLTAQRLLIERGGTNAIPQLRDVAKSANPLAQLHALWTLNGFNALDTQTRLAALASPDARVRATAIRLSEGDPRAFAALAKHTSDESQAVRLQLALSLGAFREPPATALFAELLAKEAHPLFRTAVLSGLAGRELEFLNAWPPRGEQDQALVSLLAQCVLEEAKAPRVAELFARFAKTPDVAAWQRAALLEAFASIRYAQPFALAEEPTALTALLRAPGVAAREKVLRALSQFTWPGAKPPDTLTQNAPPLTPEEERRVQSGQPLYAQICASCHQPHGGGNSGTAPPLAGSDWVSGPPDRLVRVILHGLYGPVQVNGQTWNLHMPALGAPGVLDDEKLASVLSYIRRAWGNAAPPVEPAFVAAVRKETDGRTLPWRAEELAQVAAKGREAEVIKPAPNGEFVLPASKATVFAQRLAYRPSLDVLAPWVVAEDVAEWRVEVARAGDYEVTVNLAADRRSAGDAYAIETETSRTRGVVPDTGGYDQFKEQPSGRVSLRAGVNRVLLRPDGKLKQELADVRGLRLVPVW
ncbi:MAG: c-type cytochrome [Pedosphaera sp.]|nr:c-type cytochrome [Pedosphaera sp.]